jgi:hypothetical protein
MTTTEDELLRCCARVSLGSQMQTRLEQLLSRPIDWEVVLERSWWHRIRPLTYLHLRAQPAGRVPDTVLLELAAHSCELAERNRRLKKALADIAQLFEVARLPAIVFKGPPLAEAAYGDLSLRECGDLDLLVDDGDFPAVEQLLRAHGFSSWWDRDHGNRQVFACEFERSDANLDVHWNLAPGWFNFRIDFRRLWQRGVPLQSGSPQFRTLRPEDSLSILCIHGTKHWWERLRWICDVAELINSRLITDWNDAESSAIQANCRRSVYLGLWLASELLSADLPDSVRRRLERTAAVGRLGAQVCAWLEAPKSSGNVRKLRERFLFRMGACERMRDRVPQLMHYLWARPSGRGQ